MAASTLEVLITGDSSGLRVALTQGATSAKRFESSVGGVAKSARSALGSVVPFGAAAAGAAVGLFAKQSLDAAVAFDQSMTRIAALTNTPTEAIGGLRDTVLSLARETAQSPQQLADAMYFLASAGLTAQQQVDTLTASAKAAAVGLGSAADIARITANALNVYGDSGLKAADVTDTLVAAVREGSAEPDEFANALGRVLPIADKAGISFQQVAASLATMSNAGLDVNEGVTALRGVLQSLVAPTTQTQDALAGIGLTADDVVSSMQQNGLIATLRLLDRQAKRNTSSTADYNIVMRNLIPNVRALTGVFNLTGQEAKKVDRIFQSVANSTGSLDKAFETTQQSVAFRFKKALNDIQIAGQQVAAVVLPFIASALGDIADSAANASDAINEVSGWLETLAAKAGGTTDAADQTASGIGRITESAKDLLASGRLLFTDMPGFVDKVKNSWFDFTDALHGGALSADEANRTLEEQKRLLTEAGVSATDQAVIFANAMADVGGSLNHDNIDAFTQAIQAEAGSLADVQSAQAQARAEADRLARSQQRAREQTDKWQESTSALAGQIDQLAVAGIDVNSFLQDFRKNLQDTDDPLTVIRTAMSDIASAAAEWRQQTADAITGVGDVLGTLAGKAHLTASDISDAFVKAADAARSFSKDLVTIAKTGGETGKALASALLQGGPAWAGLASTIASSGEEMRTKLIRQFGDILSAGDSGASALQKALMPVLNDIRDVLVAIAQSWGITVTDNAGDAKRHVTDLNAQLESTTRQNWEAKVAVAVENTSALSALDQQIKNIPKFTQIIVQVHTQSGSPWPDEALKSHLTDPMLRAGFKKIAGVWTLPLRVAVHSDIGGNAIGNVSDPVGAVIGGAPVGSTRSMPEATLPPWYQAFTHHLPRLPEGHTRVDPNRHGGRDTMPIPLRIRLDRKHFDEQLAYQTEYGRGY